MRWRDERGGGDRELSKQKWYDRMHNEQQCSGKMTDFSGDPFNMKLP